MPTSAPTFHDQFILARDAPEAPDGFVVRSHEGWWLASSPTLPVTRLTSEGEAVGWMLGWAVLPDGSFAHEHPTLELPTERPGETAREDRLYTLPGRWLCHITAPVPRVYLDPAGSLAMVYDVKRQVLASTTTLLNWADPHTLSRERFDARSLGRNQFHPSGLTSDPAARRLLPNHYLALSTGQQVRHWPRGPIDRVGTDDVAGPIGTIVEATSSFVAALGRHRRLHVPLTAGRDSRMVMSMSRATVARIDFFTFAYLDWRRSDKTFARSLSRRLGLSHTELPIVEATETEKMHYLQAIGYDAFEGKAKDFRVAAGQLPSDRGWLTSFAGEVGRADYWTVTDGPGDVPDILTRLGLPHTEANLAATATWLRDTPFADDEQLYDLLSIEQRLGCWVGPQMYGHAPFAFNIVALNQRRVFAAMLSLPTEYVRQQLMAPDVIRQAWPELAELPFRRRPGAMGLVDRAFLSYIRLRRRARIAVLGRRDTDMDPASRAWRNRQVAS